MKRIQIIFFDTSRPSIVTDLVTTTNKGDYIITYNNYLYKIFGSEVLEIRELADIHSSYLDVGTYNFNLPNNIALISTGGTIGAAFDPSSLSLYGSKGGISVVDSVDSIAVFSEDLEVHHYRYILKRINQYLENNVEAIVITHGTDTLALTASIISYAFPNLSIPIFLLATQRGRDCPYWEGPEYINCIINNYRELDQGVYIVSTVDQSLNQIGFFPGIETIKSHTSRLNTFISLKKINPQYTFLENQLIKNFSLKLTGENITPFEIENNFPRVYLGYPLTISEVYMPKSDFQIYLGTGVGNLPRKFLESENFNYSFVVSNCPFGSTYQSIYNKGSTYINRTFLSSLETLFAKIIIGFLRTQDRDETIKYVITDIGDNLIEDVEI